MEGPQLSAEKLQNLMTQGEQKMKMMQKAVYFAGPSGAGKTTQALLATGATLVASRKKIEEKVPEDTPDDKRKIGNNNIESKTLLPEAFATSSGIYAIDGPGTGDSRSSGACSRHIPVGLQLRLQTASALSKTDQVQAIRRHARTLSGERYPSSSRSRDGT